MAESNPWSNEWMKMQEQLWRTWSDMGPRAPQNELSASSFWSNGVKQWWDAMSASAAPSPAQDLYEKLLATGKGYFSMAEQFNRYGNQQSGSPDAINKWLETAQACFTQMSQGIAPPKADKSVRDFMNFWDLPMDTWERTASALFPMPGDFTRAFHPDSSADAANYSREHLNRFLSIPAVGYSRESQEQQQRLTQQVMDYQSAMQAYNMAYARVAAESVQRFKKKLNDIAQGGHEGEQKIESLRGFYDTWVDVCEEAHAEFVTGEEYQKLYGELVNSLMRLKHHMALMVDETLEAFNVPTRPEISTLQKRQQERRRENIALRKEIEELKADVLTLKSISEPRAKAPQTKAPRAKAPGTGRAATPPAAKRKKSTKKRSQKATTTRKATKTRTTAAKR